MSQSKPLLYLKKHYCTVFGNINEDETKKIGIFFVPKNKFVAWLGKIPQLEKTSRLCDRHFDETYIVKGVTVVQDFYPSERWRLVTSALPKHFLSTGTQVCIFTQ